jgi:hypothetical protein
MPAGPPVQACPPRSRASQAPRGSAASWSATHCHRTVYSRSIHRPLRSRRASHSRPIAPAAWLGTTGLASHQDGPGSPRAAWLGTTGLASHQDGPGSPRAAWLGMTGLASHQDGPGSPRAAWLGVAGRPTRERHQARGTTWPTGAVDCPRAAGLGRRTRSSPYGEAKSSFLQPGSATDADGLCKCRHQPHSAGPDPRSRHSQSWTLKRLPLPPSGAGTPAMTSSTTRYLCSATLNSHSMSGSVKHQAEPMCKASSGTGCAEAAPSL